LGMLSIGRGLAYFITIVGADSSGASVASNISIDNSFISFIGSGYVGDIPIQVIIMIAMVIISSLLLKYSVLGRQIYAVGSNEEAARLSGVEVNKVKIFVYAMCGFLCAIAGLIEAGMLSTAATNAGEGVELDVIAAVVIGGASLMGGRGSIIGAVIGAAIIAVIHNAFVQLQMPAYVQTITIGTVIILAVSIDRFKRKK
jgi:ribose transport system permease protein